MGAHPRIDAAFPGKHTASIYGPFQAAVGVVRMGLTQVAGKQAEYSRADPTTGAARRRTRHRGRRHGREHQCRAAVACWASRPTPPRELAKWRATPPDGFTLIPQIGFSGGLDTYASVPGFLRAAYWPVQAQKFGVNLFELAHQQGFKSWYFSAQTLNFLEAAGGAPHAERIETVPNDEALIKIAQEIPESCRQQLRLLAPAGEPHPLHEQLSSAPDGLNIFDTETGSTDDRRRAAYDNGLRCWDRDVSGAGQPFLKRPAPCTSSSPRTTAN